MRLDDIVRRQAASRPHGRAFSCGGRSLTWADCEDRASRLANALLGLGLRPGDRVAVLASTCHRHWELHFATARAGLVVVPVNERLIADEVGYILDDCGATVALADQRHARVLRDAVAGSPLADRLVGWGDEHGLGHDYESLVGDASPEDPAVPVGADDVHCLGYTSGTTGRPKGAMLTHRNGIVSALGYAMMLALGPDDVFLACLPGYVNRGVAASMGPCIAGARTVVEAFDAARSLEVIEGERVTTSVMATAMLNLLLERPEVATRDLASLRGLWTGGAPARAGAIDRLLAILPEGAVVGSVYGLTEASTITRLDLDARTAAQHPEWRTSVGRPTAIVDVRLVADDGGEVATGEIGEVRVRGDTVMVGYWQDPERTGQVLRDGWFATGDLGRRDEDGILHLVDRDRDIIISGGLNVYSVELENVVMRLEAVAACAVVGVPDDTWGEAPAVFVEVRTGARLADDDVAQVCRANLAGYKQPRHVHVVDELPRNAMGKVDKGRLRAPFWAGRERQVAG